MVSEKLPKIFQWLHIVNDSVHQKPFSIIAHGAFWTAVMFAYPFVAMGVLLISAVRLVIYYAGFEKNIDASQNSLAVVITGCDSGFGRAAALNCHAKGYHVFAGCLKQESVDFFNSNCEQQRMKPILLDVCKQEDVEKLAMSVSQWIEEGKETNSSKAGKSRYLHALVNNAGRGTSGLVDWVSLDDYKTDMEVNLFGQIRLVKACLGILMNQHYARARIVNMVSCAGLVPGAFMSSYSTSKFASEGFSQCLRLELRNFGIRVVTMNPSFHETPLTTGIKERAMQTWDRLPSKTRTMYGKEFLISALVNPVKHLPKLTWKADNVVQDMMSAIELVHPPVRILTGLDAKFFHPLFRTLPDWIQGLLTPRFPQPAAFMKNKKPL